MKRLYYYTFCVEKTKNRRNCFKILHCRASCLLGAFVWLLMSYGVPSWIKFVGCEPLAENIDILRKN